MYRETSEGGPKKKIGRGSQKKHALKKKGGSIHGQRERNERVSSCIRSQGKRFSK